MRRCCLRVFLNFLWLVMFLILVGTEFHVFVLRSVMCEIVWVGGLVLDGFAGM